MNSAFHFRKSDNISLMFPCSSLVDAVKVTSLSNTRRVELEMNLDEAKLQLREARAKDFNAGRLFRLEIENADLLKQIDLYKVALEEARQLLLSHAHQSHVDLPLQLETLRRDLRSTDAALLSAQASRDAALKELEKLRFQFDKSKRLSGTFFSENADISKVPDVGCSSSGAVDSHMCESVSSNFGSIFKHAERRRFSNRTFIAADSSSTDFPANSTYQSSTFVPPHTPAPAPLAGIGVRLGLKTSGKLAVDESEAVFAVLRPTLLHHIVK